MDPEIRLHPIHTYFAGLYSEKRIITTDSFKRLQVMTNLLYDIATLLPSNKSYWRIILL